MTTATTPQLHLTRTFDAPRALVFQAFTDPDQVTEWWGPTGSSVLRDETEFDVRPGGHQRWTQVSANDPRVRVRVQFELLEVVDGQLLDGTMHVGGRLPEGFEPHETRIRIEFHDDTDGRTSVEVRHWLPDHLTSPSEQGWGEAFTRLDAALARAR